VNVVYEEGDCYCASRLKVVEVKGVSIRKALSEYYTRGGRVNVLREEGGVKIGAEDKSK
jgi:hypothetical protein